jgi:hypothetical protein
MITRHCLEFYVLDRVLTFESDEFNSLDWAASPGFMKVVDPLI